MVFINKDFNMIEVYPNLFVGDQDDFENDVKYKTNWVVVQACKNPYHKEALGYKTKGAPKDHPEYLIAKRGNRLILNLVDADDVNYIANSIVDAALLFINTNLGDNLKVLVHCNQGMSRSAGIAILFLAKKGRFINKDFNEALEEFKIIYPNCNMSRGMFNYVKNNWNKYNRSKQK